MIRTAAVGKEMRVTIDRELFLNNLRKSSTHILAVSWGAATSRADIAMRATVTITHDDITIHTLGIPTRASQVGILGYRCN